MTDAEREAFEERAAIMEYDGGLSRRDAEREARKATLRNRTIPNSCVEAGE